MMVEREKKRKKRKGERRGERRRLDSKRKGGSSLWAGNLAGKTNPKHDDGETRRAIHHVLLVAEGTRVKKREKSIAEGEVEKE